MSDNAIMREFLDSVRYEGSVRSWLDVPETDTSEDEPDALAREEGRYPKEAHTLREAGSTPAPATLRWGGYPVCPNCGANPRTSVCDTHPVDLRVFTESAASAFDEPPQPVRDGRRVTARVVLCESDGRVWIVAPESEPYVMLPGGGVDDRESCREAAHRECVEETGMECQLTRWLCDLDDQHSRRRYYLATRVLRESEHRDADGSGVNCAECVEVNVAMERLTSQFDRAAVQTAEAGLLK